MLPFKLIPQWIKPIEADSLAQRLLTLIDWDQPKIKLYGKQFLVPRKTSFLAINGITYSYSGLTHIGKGWPIWFVPFLESMQNYCQTDFNGCLINLYRNGDDCMGWHADNEEELDHQKPISSLSLGVKRDFFLRNCTNNEKYCLSLGNGDLLIMYPPCQQKWKHSIPRRKRIKDLRLNLTFRKYK